MIKQVIALTDLSIEQIKKQLIWRSRRGILALDVLLQQFLNNHFTELNQEELIVYGQILTIDDLVLLDMIHNKTPPENPQWQSIIEKIQTGLK